MIRILAIISACCCIVGAASIFSDFAPQAGYLLLAGIVAYGLIRALTSRTFARISRVTEFLDYSFPKGIIELAGIHEQHRSGRELWRGGKATITDDIMQSDYMVHLCARTLMENPDPAIDIIDERTEDAPFGGY